jgi:hypothetical protein
MRHRSGPGIAPRCRVSTTSGEARHGIWIRAASADDLVEMARIRRAVSLRTALNAYLRMGFSIIDSVSDQYYIETAVRPLTHTGNP